MPDRTSRQAKCLRHVRRDAVCVVTKTMARANRTAKLQSRDARRQRLKTSKVIDQRLPSALDPVGDIYL